MTVLALASAKGSPGTTTTATALAVAWPGGATLVDLDPAGGDVALRARDRTGNPLDPDRGLLSLAAAARRGAGETSLTDHVQESSLGVPVLLGVPSPEQLSGVGAVWSQLPQVLGTHHGDTVVDCGRVVPGSPALPMLLRADVVLFVVRPDLEGTAHLRQRLRALSQALRLGGSGGPPVGVVVRTSYRDRTVAGDLQRLLDAERLAVRVLGLVADDERGADVLAARRAGDPRRTLLGRSASAVAGQLARPVPTPTSRR